MTSNKHIIEHAQVLPTVLEKISPLNFRTLSGVDENRALNLVSYSIHIVDLIHKTAIELGFRVGIYQNATYVYNGSHWCVESKDSFSQFLKDVSIKAGVSQTIARSHRFLDDLHKQFVSDSPIKTKVDRRDKVLINLANGTLEVGVSGRNLREFDPEDFMRYTLPFMLDERAVAPMFTAYLNKVLPDAESRSALAEYTGYTFTRNAAMKLEKVLLLYGGGANGKSVFFEILKALIGGVQNMSFYSLRSLSDEKGYTRVKLNSVLVNYCSELGGKFDPEIFKILASGEPIEAREPYCSPIIVEDYCRFIFNTNTFPDVSKYGHAFQRRLLIVHFGVQISAGEQDPNLANRIISNELSGVFNWVLTGLDRLLKSGNFTVPKTTVQLIEDDLYENDDVARFLREDGWVGDDQYTTLIDLYQEYVKYCEETYCQEISKKELSRNLKRLGLTHGRNSDGIFFRIVRDPESRTRPRKISRDSSTSIKGRRKHAN